MGQVPSQKAPMSSLEETVETQPEGAAGRGGGHLICWLLDFGLLALLMEQSLWVVRQGHALL